MSNNPSGNVLAKKSNGYFLNLGGKYTSFIQTPPVKNTENVPTQFGAELELPAAHKIHRTKMYS